jgi:Lrp/AsnC family transcriptional regulator for asnA, asnC and gidA
MKVGTYHQLDPVDQKIVDLLRTDGRLSYREIARRLEVSESMVRKRATKLLDSGWMRILAISDPLKLGVPIVATTYASVSPSALERVTNALSRVESVRYLAIGVGSHNLVVESLHASAEDLHEFIQRELGKEGIVHCETIQVVKIKKSVWDWPMPTEADDRGASAPAPTPGDANRTTRS